MNKNIALYISIFILALVSGCASWSGPRGRGHSGPFEWSAEADTAMSQCQASRQRQRRELLCDAGILSGSRCEGAEVTVSYRDSVRLICDQSDASEADGGSRAISREDCERLLAADGIPADATGTVRSTPPTTADPMMQRIIAMNPALWQDDHAFCIAITSGYGTPTAGGAVPVGVGSVGVAPIGGGVPGLSVGLLGSTVGMPGVGGAGAVHPGAVSFYYPVRSYLPRNMYAQVQIAHASTGSVLATVAVGNVAPGIVPGAMITPAIEVPLTVPRGTPVRISWVCTDATGANAQETRSITGPADLGFNLTPDKCGLPAYAY